jgi:hypothetical protein
VLSVTSPYMQGGGITFYVDIPLSNTGLVHVLFPDRTPNLAALKARAAVSYLMAPLTYAIGAK